MVAVILFTALLLAGSVWWQTLVAARRQPAPSDPLLTFTVDGLDCPVWCSVRLGEQVDRLDGARVERVLRGSGQVQIRFDPKRLSPTDLERALARAGMTLVACDTPQGEVPNCR